MSRLARLAGPAALVAGVLLAYAPLLLMAPADRQSQTLTLFTGLGALIGLVGVLVIYEERGPVPTAFLGAGASVGAFVAPVLFRIVGLVAPGETAAFWTQLFLVAPLTALGLWLLAFAVPRVAPRDARGGFVAALACVTLTVLGPFILVRTPWDAHNLRALPLDGVTLYWTVGAMLLVAPLLALTTLPGDWFERWWDAATTRIMSVPPRTFAAGIVVVTTALAVGFAFYCFDTRPTTSDEIAQLWHARALLRGRLFLPPDPDPEFFAIDNVIDRPVWMSQFPIGGPAVLAIGLTFGAAWIVNPLLTGLTALNVYRFAQRVYGETQARAAAAVFAASPMVMIMGGSHMNHTATAWLVTLAMAALPAWLDAASRSARVRQSAAIGLAVGAAAAIRPLDAAIAATLIGAAMAYGILRDRTRLVALGVTALAGAIPVAALLYVNWRTTGAPLRFAYTVLWGPDHSLGLHDDPTGVPHTPWRAFLLAVRYVSETNWYTTTWPVPMLLIVAIGLVATRRFRQWDLWLAGFFGLQLAAYTLYWHDGQFAGPRFLFSAVPALLILVARAPFALAAFQLGAWRRVVYALLPVCIGAAWIRPMVPFGVQGVALEYRAARAALKRDAPPDTLMQKLPRALVFVQEALDARLVRRLWVLGVSRGDAARLMRDADACEMLEAIRNEERRPPADSAGRRSRIDAATPPRVPGDSTVVTPSCLAELAHDAHIGSAISYGPMLLRNEVDALGRIDGRVVYVIDLNDRNDRLRSRFGDREWYRWEVPSGSQDTMPQLRPYTR